MVLVLSVCLVIDGDFSPCSPRNGSQTLPTEFFCKKLATLGVLCVTVRRECCAGYGDTGLLLAGWQFVGEDSFSADNRACPIQEMAENEGFPISLAQAPVTCG